MSMVENPDMEPNSIAAVVQKGWKLNERLVRAAMVMVVKESESKPPRIKFRENINQMITAQKFCMCDLCQ